MGIPGCKGKGGGKDWGYCYNPLHGGVKNLSGGNSGSAKNLQRCTGECDKDSQCAYGLKCFQRSKGEKIPGCKDGKKKVPKDWDYCYDPKTEVKKPTKKPDPCKKNNGGCDKARKCMNVNGKAKCGNCPKGYTNLGATKCKKVTPAKPSGFVKKYTKKYPHCTNLGKCYNNAPRTTLEKACKADKLCTGFSFTTGKTTGHGCLKKCGAKEFGGYGTGAYDYFAKKAAPSGDKNLSGGNSGSAKNLKACTGECDLDSQCAKGLKCFQRSKGEKIPGCKGLYTKCNDFDGKKIEYLDRHYINAPNNYGLKRFMPTRSGCSRGKQRYYYVACQFKLK